MAQRTITSITDLNSYFQSVVKNANHHGFNVKDVVPSVMGFLISHKEFSGMKVFERENDEKRWMWFDLGNRTYNMLYDYAVDKIALRSGRKVLAHFDNSTDVATIRNIFAGL